MAHGTFTDGTDYMASEERSVSIGEETMLLALEDSLKHIKQDQQAEVNIDERYGPEGKAVNFTVKIEEVKSAYSLSWDEKFEAATKRKALGNAAVKEQTWTRALDKYDAAFKMIDHTGEQDADKKKQENDLKLSLHLNRSLMQQKLGEPGQCIAECDNALEIDSTNTKALFRQASAYMEIGDLQKAKQGFEKVKEIDPDLKDSDRQLARLRKKEKLINKKDQALFAKMMSGVGKGADEAPPAAPSEAAAEDECCRPGGG